MCLYSKTQTENDSLLLNCNILDYDLDWINSEEDPNEEGIEDLPLIVRNFL